MNDERWERIKAVFIAASAKSGLQREELLHRECHDDNELRREVETLLNARYTGMLGTGAGVKAAVSVASAMSTIAQPLLEVPGTRVGPYKLLQQIGEGGFGVVFMAEQDQPVRRRVALKIIKLGMDTKQVVARFEQERQALALMDHPNIAKVFDAGATESGRPYFVMEYVKGDPITAFADAHKLSVRDRLELFIQVCQAVQHAHTKGVIHRDIKPRNVLANMTDGRPFAKVIDFGIAKATGSALTDKTLFTEHHQLIGTPEYMSPEQAEGSPDIDTGTDVYALGVLLYELLTDATPFDAKRLRSAAFGEMQRIIKEEEPPAPSLRLTRDLATLAATAAARQVEPDKLGTQIKGELDWIAMKALDKERARRYESPNQLAADVQRHLAGEAVAAAPPSTAYRLRKYVKKHRRTVMAISAITGALFLGMTTTLWQWANAQDANARLREEVKQTRLSKAEIQFNQYLGCGYPPCKLDTAQLEDVAETRQELLGENHIDTVRAWWLLGVVRYVAGDETNAMEDMRHAVALYENRIKEPSAFLAAMYDNLAMVELLQGNIAEVSSLYKKLANVLTLDWPLDDAIDSPFGELYVCPTVRPKSKDESVRMVWLGRPYMWPARGQGREHLDALRQQLIVLDGERLTNAVSASLTDLSWSISSLKSGNLSDVSRGNALKYASIALREAPSCGECLWAIASAHYRLGEFDQCLEAASQSARLYEKEGKGQHPGNIAFTAMAQWQLDRRDEARATLAQLRELMNDSTWADDEDAKALAKEAEELIEGALPSP